jgi:hypothetical protein
LLQACGQPDSDLLNSGFVSMSMYCVAAETVLVVGILALCARRPGEVLTVNGAHCVMVPGLRVPSAG